MAKSQRSSTRLGLFNSRKEHNFNYTNTNKSTKDTKISVRKKREIKGLILIYDFVFLINKVIKV
jgi:hypothetical protein